MKLTVAVSAHVVLLASAAFAQTSFVNWESPHVSPIDLTSDGTRLLVVNTADNRLEVFAVTDFGLQHSSSIPVGLDPVSVRARQPGGSGPRPAHLGQGHSARSSSQE